MSLDLITLGLTPGNRPRRLPGGLVLLHDGTPRD